MNELTGLERVKFALEHKEADRVPLDLGGAAVTGININALRNLRKHLGFSGEPQLRDRITQLAWTGSDVIEHLGVDVLTVAPNEPSEKGLARDLGVQDGYDRLVDEFGMGWRMPVSGGHYYDLYHSPLATVETAKEVEQYLWPDPLDDARFTVVVSGFPFEGYVTEDVSIRPTRLLGGRGMRERKWVRGVGGELGAVDAMTSR